MTLTFGSLFAGIGGMDLGLERAGMTCCWQVEIDEYCRQVLAKHWPDVKRYEDVRDVGAHNLEPVDLICGGFPCQDVSVAGKRAGLDGERSGLWFEFARIIRELRPRFVLVENVPGLLAPPPRQRFAPVGRVLGDLAEIGYDAEWDCLPAAAVGAPHLRDRVFLVAYSQQQQGRQRSNPNVFGRRAIETKQTRVGGRDVADTAQYGRIARRTSDTTKGSRGREPDRSGERTDVANADGERELQPQGRVSDKRGRPSDSGADVADTKPQRSATGATREGRQGAVQNGDGDGARETARRDELESRIARFSWWKSEPDVGGTLDGFSAWLVGTPITIPHELYLAHGNATQEGPGETLRAVRDALGPSEAGGHGCVSPTEVLLAYMRELETRCRAGHFAMASAQTTEGSLRGVRQTDKPASASRQRRSVRQPPLKRADALHSLSQVLARHAESAWATYRRENASAVRHWESGIARVASGVPNRVDRLRGLGNAVVPQVAEAIGRMILETA